MASIYDQPSQSQNQSHFLTDNQEQQMYADGARTNPNVPQSHHHPFPTQQQFYPDPRAPHLLGFQVSAHSQSPPVQIPPQSHGSPVDNQQQHLSQGQQQTLQQQQPQYYLQPSQQIMQQHHFGGYNPGDASSMPPPSTMGAMNINIGATMQQGMPQRTPQSYQPQMRNNSQHMPPASPGYMQSPTSFSTPTPPAGAIAGQPFIPHPSQSPTKQNAPTSIPTSQPSMGSSISPQNAANPMQKPPQATPPTEQTPLSPEAQKRETRKIDLLLEINRVLFQEIVQLQAVGRGGLAQSKGSEPGAQGGQQSPTTTDGSKDTTSEAKDSTQSGGEAKPEDKDKDKKKIASREYIECMRRLQANFAYLTNLVSRPQKTQDRIIERPPIMEAVPPNIEGNAMSEESQNMLRDMYKSLKELFPPLPAGAQQQHPMDAYPDADDGSLVRRNAMLRQQQAMRAQAAQQQHQQQQIQMQQMQQAMVQAQIQQQQQQQQQQAMAMAQGQG